MVGVAAKIQIILLIGHLCSATIKAQQAFLREPFDQIATVGEHVTLPCRVVNKLGVLQWTRDDFGLGADRNLTGYNRYKMSGDDEEGKPRFFNELIQIKCFGNLKTSSVLFHALS